jgi:hypothetical protein
MIAGQFQEHEMEAVDLSRAMLERLGIRIEPEMTRYALRQLESGAASFAVMGGDARTGVPVRLLIDPATLREPSRSLQNRE